MTHHWARDYVGIPYRDRGRDATGVDCWGLVCMILREVGGTDVPDYSGDYASASEVREIQAVVDRERDSLWERVEGDERPLDVALFRSGRYDSHVGVVAGEGRMVHSLERRSVVVQSYRDQPWANRLVGFYRIRA